MLSFNTVDDASVSLLLQKFQGSAQLSHAICSERLGVDTTISKIRYSAAGLVRSLRVREAQLKMLEDWRFTGMRAAYKPMHVLMDQARSSCSCRDKTAHSC